MNNPRTADNKSSRAPGFKNSRFVEHVGLTAVVAPRVVVRAAALAGVLAAGAGALYVGTKAEKLLPSDNPGLSQRQAALGDISAQDGPIVIKAGSNEHSTDDFLVPNDQGGGSNNVIGQLNKNIVVSKPMEGPDGWDAVELPGANTVNAKSTVWFNVQDLIAQKMAYYLPEAKSQLDQQVGQIQVNPNGSVSQVDANGSLVPDPGAGLSHYESR